MFPIFAAFPEYPDIVARASKGAKILDIGCCLGQDLRLLAAEGIPTSQMYASDLHASLWNLGFDLFRDKDKMQATFVAADVLAQQSPLDQWRGSMDIILVNQLLHLWDWDTQVVAMKTLVKLSHAGTMIVGVQRAREESAWNRQPWGNMFIHDLNTFADIWSEVGRLTGTRWEVNARLIEPREFGAEPEDSVWMDQPPKWVTFAVERKA